MSQWYVKDISKLTGVSVQTLHHYDRINLLKPSARLSNGYRVYSEKDLLQLQQIIALKFFGFELSQIKTLLTDDSGAIEHFSIQAKLLEQKANNLLDASKTLKQITANVVDNKSIPWNTIIKLIEVYSMTQQLEHAWVKEIFTPDELKQYVALEEELKATPEQRSSFEESWDSLVAEIRENLSNDPNSAIGIELGKRCMLLTNELYGKKHTNLRTKIWEKGFGEGIGIESVGLTTEIVVWLDKAIDSYWRNRIYRILSQVGSVPSNISLKLWNEVLDDMYGEDDTCKKDIYNLALNDEKVSSEAKEWLRKLYN